MRTLFRILTALIAGALLAVGVGVAHADDISNSIDASIDAVAEVMPLNVGGPSGTTTLYLTPRNGDGKNGCNLTAGTTLVLSLSSSNTGVASVSPSSVTFTSCGDVKMLTITPMAAGPATITASQTSNNTGATFNLAPVTFTVSVTAPAPSNTAPAVSVGGVTGGASYDKGSVPSATCNVTDAEDGNSSFAATLSAITGPHATDGIGSQTASCSYSDIGGLTASSSVTYNIIDPTAPVISYTLAPAAPDGSNGWYTSDVTLTWTVTESESPNSLAKAGCVDQNITTDQVATTYSCSATSAGGSAGPVDVTIKRDATAPSVSYTSASGTEGSNGWYTSAVTATFTGTDATSGPATADQTATSSGEGAAVTIGSPAFTDNAGNITATGAASQSFKIDLTNPINVAFLGGPAADASSYFGSVPAAPTCTADDAVSGLASCQVSGYSTSVGSHTLTATATDNAGRTATATRSYTVLAWTLNGFYQPVDMNGVWNTVKGGSTVPLKFEVFAGSTELTSTSVVQSFNTQKINCTSGASTEDALEVLSAGGTSLRYDSTGGQFIQNWKTPTGAGSCYSATMTTLDGSRITAQFKIK
jgi:hypothetical protein